MQNRYVGDIGDYVKLAILRALSGNHRLGIAWWLYPDEAHNGDGRHITYLDKPAQWRDFDPELFHILLKIVRDNKRSIAALEKALPPNTLFAGEEIPVTNVTAHLRPQARRSWLSRVQSTLKEADLVFLDPDNGLAPKSFAPGQRTSGKSVLFSELVELTQPGRCLIVYHHQTRMAGGHIAEINYWAERLRASGFRTVDALRADPYSPRAFFLLNAPTEIRKRAEGIEGTWKGRITWHPKKSNTGS